MEKRSYPDEFWAQYDKARRRAEQTNEWNVFEMIRLLGLARSKLTPEHEEMIICSVEQEWTLILYEMYNLLINR